MTTERCGIGAKQTLCVHSPGGSTFLCEITSSPSSWLCGVISKVRLHRLVHIYLKNIPAKFHPDPIWNDGALSFFVEVTPARKRRTRWVAIWDQFLI